MNIDAIGIAINTYFAGERREMFVILFFCVLALVLAGLLYVMLKDSFSIGFGLLVLVGTLLVASTSITLLLRGPLHQAQLIASVENAQIQQVNQAIARENTRVEAIIRSYKFYRYAVVVLSVLALFGVLLSRAGWVNGLAAGILLLAVSQTFIDHYSELRARAYGDKLSAWSGSAVNTAIERN